MLRAKKTALRGTWLRHAPCLGVRWIMKAWLQSSDLSSKEMKLDYESALKILKSHNWEAENRLMEQLERDGIENCPAGLGLLSGKGHILHICPGSNDLQIYYHYPSRALGFLWKTQKTKTLIETTVDQGIKYVEAFFDSNWEILEKAT